MRNFFILLISLFVSACSYSISDLYYLAFGAPVPELIKNPDCEMFPDGMQVVSVTNDGILVYLLDYISENQFIKSDPEILFFVNIHDDYLNTMYDDKVMSIPEHCFIKDGTYKYTNSFGSKRTVQKIKYIQPKYIPNPEYEKAQK